MTKALLVPAAISGVLFSRISSDFDSDRNAAGAQYRRALAVVCALFVPLMAFLGLAAHFLLSIWLNEEFAENAATTARILAFGVLLNGLAHLPFAAIQDSRRPDLTAKAHIFEVPCYIILLAFFVPQFGIEGAAVAWVARAVVDAGILFWLVRKTFRSSAPLNSG
jgi:O-antigen/teichoic acid export membrane protein